MLYRDGRWSSGEETAAEIEAAIDNRDDMVDEALADLGFREWAMIGNTEPGADNPVGMRVYRRDKAPRFLIVIDGQLGAATDDVYAHGVADVMDLIARWGPGIAAAAAMERPPLARDRQET